MKTQLPSYALETEGVAKYYESDYGLIKAVDDVSLQVKPGEFVALVGGSLGAPRTGRGATSLRRWRDVRNLRAHRVADPESLLENTREAGQDTVGNMLGHVPSSITSMPPLPCFMVSAE